MVEQLTHIDMGSIQDFAGLIEGVRANGTAIMLTRNSEDVAIIKPAPRTRPRRATRSKAPVHDAALLSIIGMFKAEPGQPTDVVENVDEYLAEAYLDTHV